MRADRDAARGDDDVRPERAREHASSASSESSATAEPLDDGARARERGLEHDAVRLVDLAGLELLARRAQLGARDHDRDPGALPHGHLATPQAASAARRAGVSSAPGVVDGRRRRERRPPGSRMLAPRTTGSGSSTSSSPTTTRSIGTTESAPSGTTPPVEMSIASPAPSVRVAGRPAATLPTMRSVPGVSRGPDGEAVHRGARERRQVDARGDRLGEHAAGRSLERHALAGSGSARARTAASASSTGRSGLTSARYRSAHGVPSRRDLRRHPRAQRGAQRRPALRRARRGVRRRRPVVGGRVRRRRLDRRHLRRAHAAPRRARQRPGRPPAAQLRQGGGARRRLRRGLGRDRRHDRRRPAGRPGRDPAAPREARRGLRPRLRAGRRSGATRSPAASPRRSSTASPARSRASGCTT